MIKYQSCRGDRLLLNVVLFCQHNLHCYFFHVGMTCCLLCRYLRHRNSDGDLIYPLDYSVQNF